MRRYRVEVGGRVRVVDVQQRSSSLFRVVVEGREIEVKLSAAEDLPEGVISPEMVPAPAANGAVAPPSAARFKPPAPETLPAMIPASPPPLPPQPNGGAGSVLKAPMPGTIIAAEVKPGEAVSTGQVVFRLEAMKMVNAIKAPRDGVVAAVHVSAGQQVAYGSALLTFEEA